MAFLENRTGYYNIIFRFGGKRFIRSLKTKDEKEANGRLGRLEETIRLVQSGRLQIPEGSDTATFLLSDGQLATPHRAASTLTLSELFTQYFDSLPDGSHEASTIDGMKIHQRHLERILGKRFAVQNLTTDDLQRFVTKRSKEKGQNGRVDPNTINKSLVTFRTVWGWGVETSRLSGEFPRKGVRLPKSSELPPFQTWEEITRQTDDPNSKLWDSLYLTMDEIGELLAHVKENAAFPFIYPMFAFAAYTGARRSELLRSHISDIDFDSKMIAIREKKRVRGKLTTRRIPLAPPLERVLCDWLQRNNGPHTFCHVQTVIERSRKTVARSNGPIGLTRDEAHHHFKKTLQDSRWAVVKGWHCLRHSFISNCASRGIDQRMIDEWSGHNTEAMRRRYRHLFPNSQQNAMKLLFVREAVPQP